MKPFTEIWLMLEKPLWKIKAPEINNKKKLYLPFTLKRMVFWRLVRAGGRVELAKPK